MKTRFHPIVIQSLIINSMKGESEFCIFDLIPLIFASKSILKAFIDAISDEKFLEQLAKDQKDILIIFMRQLFKHHLIVYYYPDPLSKKVTEFNNYLSEHKVTTRTALLNDFVYNSESLLVMEELAAPPVLAPMFTQLPSLFTRKRTRDDLHNVRVDNPLPMTMTYDEIRRFKTTYDLPYICSVDALYGYGMHSKNYAYKLSTDKGPLSGGIVSGGAAGALKLIISVISQDFRAPVLLITIDTLYKNFTHAEEYWPAQCTTIKTTIETLTDTLIKTKKQAGKNKVIVLLDDSFTAQDLTKINALLEDNKDLLIQYFVNIVKLVFHETIKYAAIATHFSPNKQNRAGFIKANEALDEALHNKIKKGQWDVSSILPVALERDRKEEVDEKESSQACMQSFFKNLTGNPAIQAISVPGGATAAIDTLLSRIPNSIYITTTPTYSALLHFSGPKLIIQLTDETQYKLTPELLEDTLRKSKEFLDGRHINFLLCNPGNPVGKRYTTNELLELYFILKKYFSSFRFIVDIAHHDIYPTAKPAELGMITDKEHVLLVYSLSKTYGLPGARIGFIAGNASELKEIANTLPQKGLKYIDVTAHSVFRDDSRRREFLSVNNSMYRMNLDLLRILIYGYNNANLPKDRLDEITQHFKKLAPLYKNEFNMNLLFRGLPGVEAVFPEAGFAVLLSFPGWFNRKFRYQTRLPIFGEKTITIRNGGDIFLILELYKKFVLPGEVCAVESAVPTVRITLTPSATNKEADYLLLHTFMNLHEVARNIGACNEYTRKPKLG